MVPKLLKYWTASDAGCFEAGPEGPASFHPSENKASAPHFISARLRFGIKTLNLKE